MNYELFGSICFFKALFFVSIFHTNMLLKIELYSSRGGNPESIFSYDKGKIHTILAVYKARCVTDVLILTLSSVSSSSSLSSSSLSSLSWLSTEAVSGDEVVSVLADLTSTGASAATACCKNH